jgi:hypothetical protein
MLKKHNKLVMLILLVTFMFSMIGSASADTSTSTASATTTTTTFSDVTGSDAQSSAIYKLTSLGILNGYPDGTFGADKTITRAEFAKIAVYTAGLQDVATGMNNVPSTFSDVSTDNWANGWINVAAAQGFVKGYPDGTFAPDAQVTEAEAITVFMRILGYNDNLAGNWPADYIAKAANLGVLDDVTFAATQAAARGTVATIGAATLDQNVVVYKASDNIFEETSPVTSLLVAKFSKLQNVVEKALVSDVSLQDGKVNFTFVKSTADSTVAKASYDLASDCVFSGATNWMGAYGKVVDYMVNDSKVVWIKVRDYGTASATKNSKIEVVSPTKVKLDSKTYTVAYTTSDPINVFDKFMNQTGTAGSTLDVYLTNNAYVATDKVTFTLNEDGDIVFAKFDAYASVAGAATPGVTKAGVVSSVSDKYAKITLAASAGSIDLDEDDTTSYNIIKDGAAATFSDVKVGDMVWYFEGAYGVDFVVDSSKTATGTIDSYETSGTAISKVTLGGTTYNVAPGGLYLSDDNGDNYALAATADLDAVMDNASTAMLTPTGKVAAITTGAGTTGKIYGAINDNTVSTLVNGTITSAIEVVKEDGTLATYAPDSDSTYNGTTSKLTSDYIKNTLKDGDFVEITLNADGYIDQLKYNAAVTDELTIASGATLTGDKDNKVVSINSKSYDATNTVIFDATATTKADGSRDDYDTASLTNFMDKIDGTTGLTFGTSTYAQVKDGVLEYIVIKDSNLITTSNKLCMIAGKGTDSDGAYATILNTDGTTTKYTLVSGTTVPVKNNVIAYDLSSGKIENKAITGTGTLDGTTVYTITKINNNILTLNDGKTYYVDSDTLYFDSTNDDPAVLSLSDLGVGDNVKIFRVDTTTSALGAVQVVKTTSLVAYNAALAAVKQADYTQGSWAIYTAVVNANVVTTANTQAQVDTATANITAAQANLVKLP